MVMFHSYVSLPWNIIEKHDPSWLGGHVRGHKVGWPVAPLGREGIWFGKANEHGLRTLQIRCVEWKHVATHLTTFPKWQELCYFTGQVTHFLTAWPVSSPLPDMDSLDQKNSVQIPRHRHMPEIRWALGSWLDLGDTLWLFERTSWKSPTLNGKIWDNQE
jgi:hypothetical protein